MRAISWFVLSIAVLSLPVTHAQSDDELKNCSNLLTLGLEPSIGEGPDGVSLFADGEISRCLKGTHDRVFNPAGGLQYFRRDLEGGMFDADVVNPWLRFDFDLIRPRTSGIKAVTMAVQADQSWSHLADHSFAHKSSLTAGAQIAFEREDYCAYDNLLTYYEYEDFDDKSGMSLEGFSRSFGAEYTWYDEPDDRVGCERLGIFRRFIPWNSTTWTVGVRQDDVNNDSERSGEWKQLYFEARIPVPGSNDFSGSSFDFSARIAWVDYDRLTGDDSLGHVQAAYVRHLSKAHDIWFGLRHEENNGKGIAENRFERASFFFGLNFKVGHGRLTPDIVPTGSSSSSGRGGQSGSSDPVDPMP